MQEKPTYVKGHKCCYKSPLNAESVYKNNFKKSANSIFGGRKNIFGNGVGVEKTTFGVEKGPLQVENNHFEKTAN